jgi:hypothetical protein
MSSNIRFYHGDISLLRYVIRRYVLQEHIIRLKQVPKAGL